MLLASVDDVASARPHTRAGETFGPLEWRAYCQGYYMGLSAVIAALELAAQRFKHRVSTLRRETREKRSA